MTLFRPALLLAVLAGAISLAFASDKAPTAEAAKPAKSKPMSEILEASPDFGSWPTGKPSLKPTSGA
jgi:hypothetical protein